MTPSLELISDEERTINISSHEILCFLKVRNEMTRLPSVINHHRALGIDRFFIIDNGSEDETLSFLKEQPDVAVFSANQDFKYSSSGMNWICFLMDEFANGRWCLIIDADELFVYPNCESKGIKDLCFFLDERGYGCVAATMIDMYSTKPVCETSYKSGESLINTCQYFDSDNYKVFTSKYIPLFAIYGGPRQRSFWDKSDIMSSPCLSKVPLVKWENGYNYLASTHFMSCGPQKLSQLTSALLHFKFLDDFYQRASMEAKREQLWNNASEYKRYFMKMEEDRNLSLFHSGSKKYDSSLTLVKYELIRSELGW